jgi:16S rRNA (cytidine1402-2'-O)-methyltransferase
MTKLHEEIFRGRIDEAIERWPEAARGEVTVLVAGTERGKPQADDSLVEHLKHCLGSGHRSVKDVTEEVARERDISKRLVYQEALKVKRELSER